jgi:hypothetical protein
MTGLDETTVVGSPRGGRAVSAPRSSAEGVRGGGLKDLKTLEKFSVLCLLSPFSLAGQIFLDASLPKNSLPIKGPKPEPDYF